MPGIYLRYGDTYVAMTEQAYDAERVLQELIADHPEMLAGDDASHGRLLLVRREAGVTDLEGGGARWSLDHLYLDSKGIPTLVEVKRSSDTRGRREVVAQMLDYAANAKMSFNADQLEAWLAEDVARRGSTVEGVLREEFGVEDPERYWEVVRTNLAAERLRLIFVADRIGSELRRIIEFLNGQMARTEVLAIEVKQYVDAQGEHQTIVPRVIGNTEMAQQTKRSRGRAANVDRNELLAAIRENDADASVAAEALIDWAERDPRLRIHWTRAGDIGLPDQPPLLRIWDEATLEVRLSSLRTIDPSWDADRIESLVQRLESIEGVQFPPGKRKWPRTPLATLADPQKRDSFLAVFEGVIASLPYGSA